MQFILRQFEVLAFRAVILGLGLTSIIFGLISESFFSLFNIATVLVVGFVFFATFFDQKNRNYTIGIRVLWLMAFVSLIFLEKSVLEVHGRAEFWHQTSVLLNLTILLLYSFSVFKLFFAVASWLVCWGVLGWFYFSNSEVVALAGSRGPASFGVDLPLWQSLPLDRMGLQTLGLGALLTLLSAIKSQTQNWLSSIFSVRDEKMSLLGSLSLSLGHELSTPITSLKGYVEMLKSTAQVGVEPDALKILERMEFNLGRMSDIAHALKGFSQKESPKSQVSAQELVKDVSILFEHHLKSQKIDFEVGGAADNVSLFWNCNRVEVGQILFNLVANARDAVNTQSQEKKIKIQIEHDTIKKTFKIAVHDSGAGVAVASVDQIFDAEFTTKPFGEGSGMGLWISKTLAEKNNLSLEIEPGPSPLGGACFVLAPIGQ
jgi:signal transduction histidine kinase